MRFVVVGRPHVERTLRLAWRCDDASGRKRVHESRWRGAGSRWSRRGHQRRVSPRWLVVAVLRPEVMGGVINEVAERNGVLLQGRRTYQVSAAAWPERSGDRFSDWINRAQKYVVSDAE